MMIFSLSFSYPYFGKSFIQNIPSIHHHFDRFNLENDLLIRDTEHINRRSINRKTCFRRFALFVDDHLKEYFLGEFFYLCHLNYSHLSTDSSLLLWQRLIGVVNKQNTDEPIVPLLLSDPIALLLQILLRLPFNITKGTIRMSWISYLLSQNSIK